MNSAERLLDRSGLVRLGFGRVYVLDRGPGRAAEKPPMLLLHDFALCSHTWSELIPDLGRDRRVVAPDLPGTGNSDRPDPQSAQGYAPAWIAAQIVDLLDALDLDEVDVVGHGLGAAAAVLLPAGRVRRLVLIAPLCFPVEAPFGPALRVPVIGPLLLRGLLRKSEFRDYMQRQYSTPELMPKSRFDVYWDRISRDGGMEAAYAMMGRMADLGDLADHYRAASQPALVVWGDRDRIFPVEDAERAAELLPNGRLVVIDGCGHAPQEERPREVLSLIREHC